MNDNRSDREHYRVFYRFLGAIFIVVGVIWLTPYGTGEATLGKVLGVLSGMSYSRVPRYVRNGWFVHDLKYFTRADWFTYTMSLMLAALAINLIYNSTAASVWILIHVLMGMTALFYGGLLTVGRLQRFEENN